MPPPLGITFPARVVEVLAGDSITVEPIPKPLEIHLLGCCAPEIRTTDKDEQRRFSSVLDSGEAAQYYLRSLVQDQVVTVHIPTEEHDGVQGLLTFGRVEAQVYDAAGRNVSEMMREADHATLPKHGNEP